MMSTNDGSWAFGWGWLALLGMLVCVAMMVTMMRHGTSGTTRRTTSPQEDAPERILAKRLASGEIDVEEFERLRDALQRTNSPTEDAGESRRVERHSPPA